MAENEERPEKRQRLTPNDWESKVLGSGDYSEVLPHNEVPFVNRHSELFDLFHVNAAVILKLLDCRRKEVSIDDWRPCSVAVAAQMFGSGKTTLGRNFITQLKDSGFQQFYEKKKLGAAWQQELTQAQSATMQHFDLRSCTTLSHVVYKLYGRTEGGPETVKIAEWIFAKAVECNTPLFVHFDEVGPLGANVRDLRDAVQQTWHLMLQCGGDMPRIYFYLSGKSVPLNSINKYGSPVGTKWIILDLLEEKHIQCIVEAATSATPSSLCPPLAKIQGLPAALRRWTGGSPRLLVYSLRVLHHLLHEGRAFDNAEKAMQEVYGILKDQQAVASEVFLAEEDEAEWQQTWLYLILLAQLRVPCQRKTFLPVGSAEHSLDLLLGRLNVYISKPEQPIEGMSDAFYISHMKMVEKFVREKYSSDCRVPLFLGGEAAGISAEDLLERMVEQRIIVQACMCQGQRWGDVMKPLLHGTQAETLAVVLDQGCPLDTFPKITSAVTERKTISLPLPANLHPGNLAAAMQRLNSNRLYRPAPKSNSADLFIKQQELIIELQDKSGVTAGVSFFDACQEVAKCIQEGPVLWVLVALKLTDSLLCCVGTKKPLLLTPGVYQEEKSAEGGLLYRPNGKSKKWQKRILHGTWSDLGSSRVEAKHTSRLEVREGLELVIPHPEHVKQFLGDDFEIVKKLAERRKDDAPGGIIKIPFLSRFYNFQKPRAQGSAAPAQPTVIWACQLRKDGTTIEVAGNAFKVTGAIADVADLKDAIKKKTPKTVTCDAHELDIYSQKDGHWVTEETMSASLRDTTEADCYGFVLPSADDA